MNEPWSALASKARRIHYETQLSKERTLMNALFLAKSTFIFCEYQELICNVVLLSLVLSHGAHKTDPRIECEHRLLSVWGILGDLR